MTHIHDVLAQVQHSGAQGFGDTALARDHTRVARRVGRARAARTATVSVLGVGAAGVLAVTAQSMWREEATLLPATPVPSATPSPSPTPSPSVTPEDEVLNEASVMVNPGARIDRVVENLAEAFDVSTEEALQAIIDQLPPEAEGEPEGWVATGEFVFAEGNTLEDAANTMVWTQMDNLQGIDPAEWRETLIRASIVQREIVPLGEGVDEVGLTTADDMAKVARVIVNRLQSDMMLQMESPLAYYLRADERTVGDDGWAVETPYNLFMNHGLPPTPIGAPSDLAIRAVISPAEGDWMFFLIEPETGSPQFFSDYGAYLEAIDKYFPGTGASD